MLPGSVNLWDLVEMLYYMERFGWDGWLSYDVATRDGSQIEQMSATISIVESAMALIDKIGRDQIQSFIEEGLPARAFDYLVKSLL
jgi:xylose isomerase